MPFHLFLLRALTITNNYELFPDLKNRNEIFKEIISIKSKSPTNITYDLNISYKTIHQTTFNAEIIYSINEQRVKKITGEYYQNIIRGVYVPEMDQYSKFEVIHEYEK